MALCCTFEEKKEVSFGRCLVSIYNSLCANMDLEEVSSELQGRDDVSIRAKKLSRKAAKLKDLECFYGVLCKFDFQSFVGFVEVIEQTSKNNEKHSQLFSVICSSFKNLAEFSSTEDQLIHSKLKSMIERHECELSRITIKYRRDESSKDTDGVKSVASAMASLRIDEESAEGTFTTRSHSDLLTIRHEIESEPLEYSGDEGMFYSHVHGVRVTADRCAFPSDSLNIVLSVNDYSRRIVVPEDYKASFSALISLKCDPEVDEFLDYVTVAVPHCAHGDTECLYECLCVLSASECGDSKEPLYLQEDSDIEIVSIDEHYFTFKTEHFTRFKVAANTKKSRKQRQSKKTPKKASTSIFKSQKSHSLERSSSFPESDDIEATKSSLAVDKIIPVVDERFVAIRVFPEYEAGSPQECLFVITYDASDTFVEVRILLLTYSAKSVSSLLQFIVCEYIFNYHISSKYFYP